MRIVFIGTPHFAVETLKALLDAKTNVVGVITAPDKKAGRGKKIQASPVKEFALANNLAVLQPTNLKSPDFLEELRALKADIQIVVAFRMLPEAVWNMPPKGTFNLHASLLPNYRGAAPINWAIINGEKKTGITTFFLKHKIDTGNIIDQQEIEILDSDNAGSLHDKLMAQGAQLVVETVKNIENNTYNTIEQPLVLNEEFKDAPKLFKTTCKIDWNNPAEKVHNLIRGLSPYPCAFTSIKVRDKLLSLKIFQSEFERTNTKNAGSLHLKNNQLGFECTDGIVWLKEVQLEGKKRVSIEEFLRGYGNDVSI